MENTIKRPRRPYRSAESWREIVDAWRRSGLSATRYATNNGLCVSSLYKWSARIPAAENNVHKTQDDKAISFVKIKVGESELETPKIDHSDQLNEDRIEILLPSGLLVRCSAHVSEQTLARLLRILVGAKSC